MSSLCIEPCHQHSQLETNFCKETTTTTNSKKQEEIVCENSRDKELQLTKPLLIQFAVLFKLLLCYVFSVHIFLYKSKLLALKKKLMETVTVLPVSKKRTSLTDAQNLVDNLITPPPSPPLTSSSSSSSLTEDEDVIRGNDGSESEDFHNNGFHRRNNLRLSVPKNGVKRNLESSCEDGGKSSKSPSIQKFATEPPKFLDTKSGNKCKVSVLNIPHHNHKVLNTSKKVDFSLDLRNISCTVDRKNIENTIDDIHNNCFNLETYEKDAGIELDDSSFILPIQLGSILNLNTESILLMDCRSFMKFNSNHICGAINACCTNNTIRKRFKDGKIGLVDLVSGVEEKGKFKETLAKNGSIIVVYDDDTCNIEHVAACNSLKAIFENLLAMGANVKYLKGGLKDFLASQSHHCSVPQANEIQPLLFSPTSPYIDAAIDTAVMTEILPYLYLGNEKDAADISKLQNMKITHVLNVTASIPLFCEGVANIIGRRLPASDSGSQNIKQYFKEAIQFIEMANSSEGRVLIHCQAGVSRSPTITMAYLMSKFSCSSMEAFNQVKSKRPIISPNINFLGQLLEYESRT